MTDVVSQYVSGRTVQEQMSELMKFVSTVNGKSVKKIEGRQSQDTVTVTVTYEDDRTDVFSFQSTPGVTRDTEQTISGMKVFTAATTQFAHDVDVGGDLNAAGTLEIGENADIDGDVNCQNATVAGNLKVAGAVQDDVEFTGDNVEIGQMSLEKDGNTTVISNAYGIRIADDTVMSIPDTATGIKDKKAVNGKRLQNDLDAYASMVRTSGNQTISGVKNMTGILNITRSGHSYHTIQLNNTSFDVNNPSNKGPNRVEWFDVNNLSFGWIGIGLEADGRSYVACKVRNSDGTYKETKLLRGD